MEEKDLQNGESGQEKDNGNPYIEALKEMKEKTVSRESYEKLKGENEQLVRAIINGDSIEVEEEKEEVDIDKLRKELFTEDNNMSNLEFAKNALELRKAKVVYETVDYDYEDLKKAQAEIERLSKKAVALEVETNNQKAKIERLTEELKYYRGELQ